MKKISKELTDAIRQSLGVEEEDGWGGDKYNYQEIHELLLKHDRNDVIFKSDVPVYFNKSDIGVDFVEVNLSCGAELYLFNGYSSGLLECL